MARGLEKEKIKRRVDNQKEGAWLKKKKTKPNKKTIGDKVIGEGLRTYTTKKPRNTDGFSCGCFNNSHYMESVLAVSDSHYIMGL